MVLVTGPRQVGKTTMLQKIMKGMNRGYITLDDLNERNIAKTDPELFTYIKMYVDKTHEAGAF
ncbi:MAG: AAA family ATPase [Lachnospiraceae bacterium]|nr:AAA family ATPase [Lachnospiraceae bacterium]